VVVSSIGEGNMKTETPDLPQFSNT